MSSLTWKKGRGPGLWRAHDEAGSVLFSIAKRASGWALTDAGADPPFLLGLPYDRLWYAKRQAEALHSKREAGIYV